MRADERHPKTALYLTKPRSVFDCSLLMPFAQGSGFGISHSRDCLQITARIRKDLLQVAVVSIGKLQQGPNSGHSKSSSFGMPTKPWGYSASALRMWHRLSEDSMSTRKEMRPATVHLAETNYAQIACPCQGPFPHLRSTSSAQTKRLS